MIKTLSALGALAAAFAASAAQAQDDGHLFIVYNYESGHVLIRGNISDAEIETIAPETQSIRASGWGSADVDPTPGHGAIGCVRDDGNVPVWFTWSTGHPDQGTAIELVNRAAQKHAREAGGTYVPNCGPAWNNDGGRIWLTAEAAK